LDEKSCTYMDTYMDHAAVVVGIHGAVCVLTMRGVIEQDFFRQWRAFMQSMSSFLFFLVLLI